MSEDLSQFLKGIDKSYKTQGRSILKQYEGIAQNDPNMIRSLVGVVLGIPLMGYEMNHDLGRLQAAVSRFNELSGLTVELVQNRGEDNYHFRVGDLEISTNDSEVGPAKMDDQDF